jgi:hypothetical protein
MPDRCKSVVAKCFDGALQKEANVMNGNRSNCEQRNEKSNDSEEIQQGTSPLLTALAQLEMCLETPVMCGELPSWCEAVEAAHREVREPLWQELDSAHPIQFAHIGNENGDLLRRVEQLSEEDAFLRQLYTDFADALQRFCKRSEIVEPQEDRMDKSLAVVINGGLSFVIRVRTQQQAIATWLIEAFHRDTGVAD